LTIQFMGTPASKDLPARSKSAFDLGRSSLNFFCSRRMSAAKRARSIDFMRLVWKNRQQDTRTGFMGKRAVGLHDLSNLRRSGWYFTL
jgi:hypothetical protein